MAKRKCFKCGSTNTDPDVVLYRFPRPGITNVLRCEKWAKYVFPDRPWYSQEFQKKLYTEHRMLCQKHFKETSFINFASKKLHKHAYPEKECDKPSTEVCVQQNDPLAPGLKLNVPVEENRIIDNVSVQDPNSSGYKESVVDIEGLTSRYEEIAADTIEDEEPEPTSEDAVANPFSWQQSNAVVPCDVDLLEQEEGTTLFGDEQSKEVNEEARITDITVYHCNECEQEIFGYRYICVQCSDYELCSTCEGKGLHFLHYVLRVPACKTQVEVESVLTAVRRAINSVHLNHDQELEIKEETEVLLDESNPERDPFAEDVSDAGVSDTVLENSDLIPDKTHFENNLDRSCSEVRDKTGDMDLKLKNRAKTSTIFSKNPLGILPSNQATGKCESNNSQDTTKKIIFVPKNVLVATRKSLQPVKVKLKCNSLATEGTMRTTKSIMSLAKDTVSVTAKTMLAQEKSFPIILRNNSTIRTVPTILRTSSTKKRPMSSILRTSSNKERILSTTGRTMSTSEGTIPTSESVTTTQRTVLTVARTDPSTESGLPSTKDSLSDNQKKFHLCIEAGSKTVTKSLKVSMPSLEQNNANALLEPVKKKLKEGVQGALFTETCRT